MILGIIVSVSNKKDDSRSKIERLYIEYHKPMYLVAFGILKNKHDAEEALQESFIRIGKYLHKIDMNDCHKTKNFLIIICRSVFINIYNRRKESSFEELDESLFENHNTVENILVNQERYNELIGHICNLNEKYQEVLLLRYSLGYTYIEIAALLKTNEATIRKRIERSKKQLLKLIGGNDAR